MVSKKRCGGLSLPIVLIIYTLLFVIGIMIFFSSARTVIFTRADVENIAQGDTILYSMLESSHCAPKSGAPFKYILGVALAGDDPASEYVSVTYAGASDNNIHITHDCVFNFLKSVNIPDYNFYVNYQGFKFQANKEGTFDAEERKKTETVYISVPEDPPAVAEVVLQRNLPKRAEKACPEKDGTFFCTPETYCALRGSDCNRDYVCGGATCCCQL